MSRRGGAGRRTGRARCGARLPSRGTARVTAAQVPAGPVGPAGGRGRAAGGDWVLLPGGTWRRVETIRVRSLFG